MTTPIPSPPGLPLIGNLFDISGAQPGEPALRPFERLADEYGPIYKLRLGGNERTIVASYDLFEELCDETRFFKSAGRALQNLNNARANGLFTSPSEQDPDWAQAHRILVPAFGPLAIRDMFDEMHDIASQLVLKWARLGSEYRIPVTEDFTRLTLDTIALCAMDYRFNSFYQDQMHPFVQAMIGVLTQGAARATTPKIVQKFMVRANEQMRADAKYQREVAEDLVKRRRENPSDKKDLLNAMINGKDPRSGQGMRDELIAANMVTFLVAGHETTSGLLSFAFYHMLKEPSTYFKAQQEVDEVLGKSRVTVDHLKDLHYVEAILRETLRLEPTAPAITRGVRPENSESPPTLGNGQYALNKESPVTCLLGKIQRDPAVWGPSANEFRPERMLDEHFNKLPKHAWKPFGTGMRACIGRPFAWQEALLVMALLLQNFDFRMDDPSYDLKIKSNLTIKPEGFYMRASLRKGTSVSTLQNRLSASPSEVHSATTAQQVSSAKDAQSDNSTDTKVTILYGSNSGTCQSLAQKLASSARAHGYQANVANMDSATNALPTNQPIAIITASYEGFPPDNAAQFVAWLESVKDAQALKGVQFAIFGCGHKDWTSTFHRIPELVDTTLEKLGATRIVDRGSSDASQGDMFSDFESWEENSFWPAISSQFASREPTSKPAKREVELEISTKGRAEQLRHNVHHGKVLAARSLTAPSEPEKRHLEIKLPDGLEYQAGGYLAVLPSNPNQSVHRVLTRFSLPLDAMIAIKQCGNGNLPINKPTSAVDLLKGFVELSQPATRKDIRQCVDHTSNNNTRETLEALSGRLYQSEVITKRMSLLDLLEAHSDITLPFGEYLASLPPMRPRHYSISSSPLRDPTTCSITYGVINTVSTAGTSRFQGVAGNYLRSLRPGDMIQVSVRSAPPAFHLPASPSTTPIMLFCNGTGFAPFHGFCQERATQLAANPHQTLAPALLFIGCRAPTADALYYDEIQEWSKKGVVGVRYAYSREPLHPDAEGCKYVQERMLRDKEDVVNMWRTGAKVFVCGSPAMVEGLKKTTRTLVEEKMGDVPLAHVEDYLAGMRNERIAVDVFA